MAQLIMQILRARYYIKLTNRNRYPNSYHGNVFGTWKAGGSCTGQITNVSISNYNINNGSGPSGQFPATIAGIKCSYDKNTTDVTNVTVNGVNITAYGGQSIPSSQPLELDWDLPNADYNPKAMGQRPAYGFYLRHVDQIKFTNSSVGYNKNNPDKRQGLYTDDVTNIDNTGLTIKGAQ